MDQFFSAWIETILEPGETARTHLMTEIILKAEVYQVIGAAMDVYYQLGPGFAEAVYQDALELELAHRRIPFQPQCEIFVYYKGQALKNFYKPDVLCFGEIVAELKVLDRLSGVEYSQIINYLKATRKRVGLLINFGSRPKLEWKRFVL